MESINKVQKFTFPVDVIIESQCVFVIENFRGYSNNVSICSETVKFFECDISWSMKTFPYYSFENISHFEVVIDVHSDEMWKSKKYQYKVLGTSLGNQLFKSDFKNIEKPAIIETFRLKYDFMLNKLMSNGSSSINIKLYIKSLGESSVRTMLFGSHKHALKQYSKILDDPTFSDFTFIIKGEEFKVHKAILASASEAMAKMFTTNFKELAQNQCYVDHIEPDIFNNLLRFIYAREIPANLDDISLELFKAAHYYGVEGLMQICKENIHLQLDAENSLEICELASVYEMEELKIEAWKIAKSQICRVFFPLNKEPPSTEDIREIMDIKEREKKFWIKHKKVIKENETQK